MSRFQNPFGAPPPTEDLAKLRDRLDTLEREFWNIQRRFASARRQAAALEANQMLRAASRVPRAPLEFRARFAEDALAWTILGRPLDGYFVEVGAFDGAHHSVTAALEAIGWSGLLVEANPAKADACRKNRPHSRVVHAALSRHGSSGPTQFTVTDDAAGGLLSFLAADEAHEQRLRREQVLRSRVAVPLTTLDELLKDHAGEIALVAIHTNGNEPDVLDGFDLARSRPALLLVHEPAPNPSRGVLAHLAAKPYIHALAAGDVQFFVRNDLADVLARAKED